MIDRAEDGDADAVRPARPDRADAERAEAPRADSPQTSAEQRAATSRRYQETVDRAYDITQVDAGEQAPAGGDGPDAASPRQDAPDAEESDAEESDQETPDRDQADGDGPEEASETPDNGARKPWAEAVVELRAAWEKHEQLYPERSRLAPTAQSDGGWRADGNRRLTPEQNAEAGKACEDIRAEGTEVILPAMERIEAADPHRRLAGLDHMLKGEDRLKEKIAERLRYNPDWTPGQALGEVPDAVRFTLEYTDNRYTDGVGSDVERLKSEGFELIKLKNLWTKEQYKGINTQWRLSETGIRFEVQFHTPTSRDAKELTHQAYERLRSPATSADEEAQLEEYQRRVNRHIPIPPGVFEIEDYPPERRDG